MKKLLIFPALIIFLVGCGGPPSVEDLINDPAKLGEVVADCQMRVMQGKNADTVECKNADEAVQKMSKNLMNSFGR